MEVFEAFGLSFFISSICIFLLLHYIFEWYFILDLFRPKNWRYFKMKKMRASIIVAVALPISLLWFLGSKQKKLKKQIVRYSESYLRTCINEALWEKEDKSDLLSFSVNQIKLKSVNHKEDQTYIKLQTDISRVFLKNAGAPVTKKGKVTLCMERAKNPSRIKNKGKIFFERDCPSCGANFMPDENNNCSYCGYGLQVYNGKWKVVNV